MKRGNKSALRILLAVLMFYVVRNKANDNFILAVNFPGIITDEEQQHHPLEFQDVRVGSQLFGRQAR